MEKKEIKAAIDGILHKLIRDNSTLSWNISCAYSDGKGQTILQLNFFTSGKNKKKGTIGFHAETGQVIKSSYYKGLHIKEKELSVIDLLLDIWNLEKSKELNAGYTMDS